MSTLSRNESMDDAVNAILVQFVVLCSSLSETAKAGMQTTTWTSSHRDKPKTE
jgi:hypothetical protein